MFQHLDRSIQQYLLITVNYWAFTLSDGALRMLVVLFFHQLGYNAFEIAMLFLFYEFFGVVTNLVGGWLGARIGLNRTMQIGLALQIIALSCLLVPVEMLTVLWVMFAQALSGIAKDLNKMSAKSAIKTLVPNEQQGRLFKWVAILTGSKNTLKGVGFFIGAALLSLFGFTQAILIMVTALVIIFILSLLLLGTDIGKASYKPKFSEIFSKSRAVNVLAAARLFLFAARDVWFVVALPVFLSQEYAWDHYSIGSFLAVWIILYGVVQSFAPKFIHTSKNSVGRQQALLWAFVLTVVTGLLSVSLYYESSLQVLLISGLLVFGFVFAINSSLHSYLIVSYAKQDGVSLDVGFYYMANAMGRLIGTVLSGWIFVHYGLAACIAVSSLFLLLTSIISFGLPTYYKDSNK